MLTLFKPFSTGLELKNADETLEAAFNKFDFSDEQKNLMNSFHVLQECDTASHKFAKQCKAQVKHSCQPSSRVTFQLIQMRRHYLNLTMMKWIFFFGSAHTKKRWKILL